jgi:hypothetical protein
VTTGQYTVSCWRSNISFILEFWPGISDDFLSMADMRRTLTVIHFASQLCGISPYGSFLRNDGYEKPVVSKKYLLYSIIMIISISVGQIRFMIGWLRANSSEKSDAHRISQQILLILVTCIFTTYLFSAITRLAGLRNFFKISRKLLSVSSFVNYHEGTIFSYAVIALHGVLLVTYLIRYSIEWIHNNCLLYLLHFFLSGLACDTVTSFAAVQFLYLVFTLRRHFMLLNSNLNEVVMSTVKSKGILSLNFRTVSDVVPERYSDISAVRDMLYHHLMLCDILELINSSYSLQVLALIGSKFVYATITLYMLYFSIFDRSLFPVRTFASVIPFGSFEVMQLVTVVYCCKSASFQVGII